MASFVTDNYKLDITPQGNYPVVYMSQFENGRQIRFRILNRGISYAIPSGVSAFVSGLKLNGGYYEHTCEIDGSRKYVVMPVESDMTDINGKGVANIVFTNGNGEKVISAKFITHTQQTVSDNGIEIPTEAETVFQQLLNEIRSSATEIDANIGGLQAELQAGIETVTENTNNAINVLSSRMDTFLVDHSGDHKRVTLWTSPDANGIIAGGTTVTLSEAVENFDYVEIYGMNTDNDVVETIPVDDTLANPGYAVRSVNISATSINLRIVESRITISGTTFTIANQYLYGDPDTTTVRQVTQSNKSNWVGQFGIMKIVGRKMTENANAEVVDIRVGADGTVYQSAGTAIRTQFANITGVYKLSVPGSSAVLSGNLTSGDFAKAYSAFVSGKGVYAVKDNEVYQLVDVGSSSMSYCNVYIGASKAIKKIVTYSNDTFEMSVNFISGSFVSYDNTNSGLNATNVQAAIDENAEGLAQANGRLTEEITSVTSRIQACENELGTHPEVEYVLPVGYESANYESSNGLRKVKYENGKFVFCNKNRTIGSVAATELTTSAFGPTVSQDLVFDVRTVGHIMLSFDYENTYSAEITPTLNLRLYDSELTGSRPLYVYIPVGSGHIDADISREIENSNINTETYPMLMIRAIGMGEHTATGEEVLTTTIEGFYEPVASTALSDRVSANETNIAKNSEDIDTLSGDVDSLSESVSGYDGRIASNTQSIEDVKSELGLDYAYTLPEGYKSANYESSNGLRKAKYENGKFVFCNKNRTVGTVVATELTTSAFSPAVSQDLVLDVRTVVHPVLSFDYENTYSSEITPTLNLRMYNAELTGAKPIYVYIPIGSGHIDVDILKEIEDNNINTETHPMLLIRAIGMGEHTATGEEVLSTTIEGFYDDGASILNTVASLKDNIESVKEYGTNKTSCTFQNPFRFNKPYWAHFFLNTVNDADIYVPSQSLYDIQISKRMGFDVIEANVHTLSDGTAICLHGDNFKFGVEFESADGVTDVQNTVIASVDYEWVKTYVRYKAKFPKLRVCPPTLEEFLLECKKYRMIPYINFRDPSHIELADKIMGLENYVLYGDGRAARRYSNTMVASWANFTTKQQIVDWVEMVGNPCMVGCMHPENFTAEEWVDIIETVHQMGAVIAWSEYNSPSDWLKLIDYGMDLTGATYGLNPTEHGNLQNFSSALGFSDYTVVNGVESPGQLTMQNDGTVTLANTIGSAKFLTGMWLDVTFIGSISVSMGRFISHANCQSTSTKSKTIRLSTYFMNAIPNFEVKALSAGTIIENIDCKVSEF